jgi:hypothetical protein
MRQPSPIAVPSLALCILAAAASAAVAQRSPIGQQPSEALSSRRPRVEVNPGRLLYRRCEVQYVVQYRPSGTVLFPAKHCWWVRG